MKKRILKNWVVNTLATIIGLIISFLAITIDSLGNQTYNIILVICLVAVILNTIILSKYSNFFED